MPSTPELPFTMVEEEFQALGRPPNALRIACAAFSAALPPGPLSPSELRETLLQKTTAFETRDEALAWVMGRAQTDGDRWMVAALGMLLPGLRSQTACLSAWCPALVADVQAEVLDARSWWTGRYARPAGPADRSRPFCGVGVRRWRRVRRHHDYPRRLRPCRTGPRAS